MTSFARLLGAVSAAVAAAAPAIARAQADVTPAGHRNFGWLWIIAAVLVIVALFRMFFGRSGRAAPPRRP